MYSIETDRGLIKGLHLVKSENLYPHEDTINSKVDLLVKYLESFNNSVIISSIIYCSKNMVIIDGHHRFEALKKLGFREIPATAIDYFSKEIKTNHNELISKEEIISSGLSKKFLNPKSTNHLVYCKKSKSWNPVILLSSLFKLDAI